MDQDQIATSVPTFDALFNPTLDSIRALGGSASNTEIVNRVIDDLGLPPEVNEVPHGNRNQTELEYRLGWSRTYLKKYGLIDNSDSGVWSLTASGRETTEVQPADVKAFVRKQRPARLSATSNGETSEPDYDGSDGDSDEELIVDPSDEPPMWRESLMGTLLKMSPQAFERLCQRLLRESGFIEVQVTGAPGDGGIDGHGIIRLAGLISFPVMFQCKRYTNNVGSETVRNFRGAMEGRADKGLIITTGGFTREAYKEATREGAKPIDLIDGDLLVDKIKELGLGVSVTTKIVEIVEVDQSWFEAL